MGLRMSMNLEWGQFVWGIFLGISGIAILASAYPLFNKITQKQREKIAPEILRLSEEISKDNFSEK